MTPPEESFVNKTISVVKALMALYGELQELDVLWAGAPAYNSAIDQNAIDSVPAFAGLTATELSDAEFSLASIKNTITGTLPAFSVLDNLPS